MGTSTTNSHDPRTPVQRRGNIWVFVIVLAMVGAVIYGYVFSSASKRAGVDAALSDTEKQTITPSTPTNQ